MGQDGEIEEIDMKPMTQGELDPEESPTENEVMLGTITGGEEA